MAKIFVVAKHEYLKLVKKRSFILSTLGFPVLIAVISTISILASLGKRGVLPVGYVDDAKLFGDELMLSNNESDESVYYQAFISRDKAISQLRSNQLQAVYIIPVDYRQTGKVELYYQKQRPSAIVQEEFDEYMRMHLLRDLSPGVQRRLLAGNNLIIQSSDSSREFDSRNIITFIIPFVTAFLFVIAVMSAGGYMLEAVTKEKVNRTIEILVTSLRPEELIGGKALGLMGVGLTQLMIWAVTGVVGLVILTQFFYQISTINIPWSILSVVIVFFLPAYALMSGMMVIIGSLVSDNKQGQQISGIINILFTSPFFFLTVIMAKPNHPLVIGLSLFPTTAFITITMRWAMTTIPIWQLITSLVILSVSAIFSIWVAARVFRYGMLRYGQSFKIKHLRDTFRRRQTP